MTYKEGDFVIVNSIGNDYTHSKKGSWGFVEEITDAKYKIAFYHLTGEDKSVPRSFEKYKPEVYDCSEPLEDRLTIQSDQFRNPKGLGKKKKRAIAKEDIVDTLKEYASGLLLSSTVDNTPNKERLEKQLEDIGWMFAEHDISFEEKDEILEAFTEYQEMQKEVEVARKDFKKYQKKCQEKKAKEQKVELAKKEIEKKYPELESIVKSQVQIRDTHGRVVIMTGNKLGHYKVIEETDDYEFVKKLAIRSAYIGHIVQEVCERNAATRIKKLYIDAVKILTYLESEGTEFDAIKLTEHYSDGCGRDNQWYYSSGFTLQVSLYRRIDEHRELREEVKKEQEVIASGQ